MPISPDTIIEHYEGGYSIRDIMTDVYSGLTYAEVKTVLEYAAKNGQSTRSVSA